MSKLPPLPRRPRRHTSILALSGAALAIAALVGSAFVAGRATEVARPRPGSTATVELRAASSRLWRGAGTLAALGLLVGGLAWRHAESRGHRGALAGRWHRLRQVTHHLPTAICYFDRQEHCCFANDAARQWLLQPVAGSGTSMPTLRELVGAQAYAQLAGALAEVRQGRRARCDTTFERRPHQGLTVHLVPDCDERGEVLGLCLMASADPQGPRDDADADAVDAARAEAQRHLRAITDHVPALITYVDTDERVTFANATFKTWLGVDPTHMMGKPLIDVLGEAMYRKRRPFLERGLAGEQLSFEIPTRTPTGERDLRTTYIPDRRADGSVAGIFVMVTDVTAMRTAERQLQALARVDTLTGLPNRRAFEERAEEAMSRSRGSGHPLVMMFLDLDRFKSINDERGHAAGDAVLNAFAARLRTSVRETDMVARLAGDEFVVLLEGVERPEGATMVAQRILDALALPLDLKDGRAALQMATSIGIAAAAPGECTPHTVLARADAALYAAKRSGRGGYVVAETPATVGPAEAPQAARPIELETGPVASGLPGAGEEARSEVAPAQAEPA